MFWEKLHFLNSHLHVIERDSVITRWLAPPALDCRRLSVHINISLIILSLLKSLWTLIFCFRHGELDYNFIRRKWWKGLAWEVSCFLGTPGFSDQDLQLPFNKPIMFFLCIKFSLWILDVNGKYSLIGGDVLHFLPCSNPAVEGRVQSVVHCMTRARLCKGGIV